MIFLMSNQPGPPKPLLQRGGCRRHVYEKIKKKDRIPILVREEVLCPGRSAPEAGNPLLLILFAVRIHRHFCDRLRRPEVERRQNPANLTIGIGR